MSDLATLEGNGFMIECEEVDDPSLPLRQE